MNVQKRNKKIQIRNFVAKNNHNRSFVFENKKRGLKLGYDKQEQRIQRVCDSF
jgi:hypothetical protein